MTHNKEIIRTEERHEYKRSKNEEKYYDVDHLIQMVPNANYYIIYNGRDNGKTFNVSLKQIIKKYFEDNTVSVYIRRYDASLKGSAGAAIPLTSIPKTRTDILEGSKIITVDNPVSYYSHGEWDDVVYWSQRWWFTRTDDDGNVIRSQFPFCYAYALNVGFDQLKGIEVANVGTVVFDEFMSAQYLADEFDRLQTLLNTIIRTAKKRPRVFMLGNAINPICPHFKQMGLKHAGLDQKPGTVDIYQYRQGDDINVIAVERAAESTAKKASNQYFIFDNAKAQMAVNGEWDIQNFPRIKKGGYDPKDIVSRYFIHFEDEYVQADVVERGDEMFTAIHPCTLELFKEHLDDFVVYDANGSYKINRPQSILHPATKLQRAYRWFFDTNNVFYSDNFTGNLVHMYLDFCKNLKL